MVGACLALALSKTRLNIALVEAVENQRQSQPSFDDRCLALSRGSVNIMQALDLWRDLCVFASPIEEILVCDRGHFGFHRMSASQYPQSISGRPFLGQVITSKDCGQVFWKRLSRQSNLQIFCPAKLTHLKQTENKTELTIACGKSSKTLSASLVVAADGAHSITRKLSTISESFDDYGQAAIIANIQTQLTHQHRAIERFTEHGPLALLPLADKLSLVWTVPSSELKTTLALSDQSFIQQLQPIMGQRLGRITKVGKRVGYPLKLMKTECLYKNRTLLLGNASHSIHPIAGQGFNLGLRDVAWLTQMLIEADPEVDDIGGNDFLQSYALKRQPDIDRTIQFTDTLARLFVNSNWLLTQCRNLALTGLPFISVVQLWLAETAMGLGSPVPRLACGENIQDLLSENNIYAHHK